MSQTVSAVDEPGVLMGPGSVGKRSRYGFALYWGLTLVVAWFLLRGVLFLAFRPAGVNTGQVLMAFLSGLHRDVLMALLETLPLLCWLWITPNRRFAAKWHRFFFWAVAFVLCFVQVFLLAVEFFFFDEFRSRFNTVAVDYLIYPHEVFINIWQSYHVGVVLVVCGLLSLAWLWWAARIFKPMWERPVSGKTRILFLAAGVVAAGVLSATVDMRPPHVSDDRTLNEVGNNGALSFVAAAWTHHLDYGAFYKCLPRQEAYEIARKALAQPNARFTGEGETIRRKIAGDPSRPKLNVVICLEESLGSEFWGCLGRTLPTLTPEMDKLATEEGLLFTHLFASGNRTVRGMEGVLSSFPPLPGDSIVKRDMSDNVETIARVLKRDGYSTLFLYGGRGVFDGMRSFAVRNGYDRFIEQKDFEAPVFTTIWGVSDEDLFNRGVEEFRKLDGEGKPFFATLLTVSNHKPYTYPKGRIPENPDLRQRDFAVKYTDYALGKFFRDARKERFWTNTVFVVIADHGARVYGSQSIPIHSYEIPMLIAGPAVVKSPARIPQLGGSLDVSPTILGLIGRPYESLFMGRDLLNSQPAEGRALLNHNRDIGLLAGERMVVLGLMQTEELYGGHPGTDDMKRVTQTSEAERELARETMALFQVADDLYVRRQYCIDGANAPSITTASNAGPASRQK